MEGRGNGIDLGQKATLREWSRLRPKATLRERERYIKLVLSRTDRTLKLNLQQ
ncbi:MAG: hypothetical protein F6K26_25195 [Moorea sp. SIO2I5]|nr:hypothetical protein [Moorena sp. SIO2I5]